MTPLARRLWQNILAGGRRDFLVSPGRSLAYRDLQQGIGRWLAQFDAAGLVPGDRFVVRTGQDDVACVAFLAGLVDGVVPVMLEGSCPDARLQAIVGMVEPGLVLSDDGLPDLPQPVRRQVLTPRRAARAVPFLAVRPQADFGLPPGGARAPRLPDEDGLAYLLFTSGTTAAPSGVMIRRDNLAANLRTLTRLFGYTPESRIFNDMILAHADGMIQGPVLAAWTGAAVLRAGGFDVNRIEDWLGCIRRFRATHVLTVPTVWSMIDRFAVYDDYFDAPELGWLMTVAAKMPPPLWDRIEARFGRPLANQYGLTETVVSALYAGSGADLGARGTIGRPVDCEARIAEGAAQGELQVRGANVFSGYWRNAARTADSFTADGWFRTGDLAAFRPDGSYEVTGRLKTAIVSGGVLIHPEEVDDALLRHPAVFDSATIGVPDETFGEIVVSCVVLSMPCSETVLTEHLRLFVEPRKVSRHVLILPALPRGPSGKPQLDRLRAQAAEMLAVHRPAARQADRTADLLAVAARVFRVPVETLSLSTTPRDQDAWDSFTQLNLVLAVEEHFGCTIPASRVSALRSLGDVLHALDGTP